jgi:hypothetical protein
MHHPADRVITNHAYLLESPLFQRIRRVRTAPFRALLTKSVTSTMPENTTNPRLTSTQVGATDQGTETKGKAMDVGESAHDVDLAQSIVRGKSVSSGLRSWLTSSAVNEDLSHGQIVIVMAKWVLVFAGMLLVLWAPAPIGQLRVQILVLVLIAVENFYHHAQILKRRPVPDAIAYIASGADLAVVTILVMLQGGFDSNLYIFYFPALIALSVVFRTEVTALFTAVTVSLYTAICLVDFVDGTATGNDFQVMLARIGMMVALVTCGALSYRLEARRRTTGTAANTPPANLPKTSSLLAS